MRADHDHIRLSRRTFSGAIAAAMASAVFPRASLADEKEAKDKVALSAPAGQWPIFRGNAHSTGKSSSQLPNSPELLWKYEVEGGCFKVTAAIDEGVVYIGDADGEFYAIELATGRLIWKVETESGFHAPAGVRGDKVYVGDYDGVFRCFAKKTGEELWRHDVMAEINSSPNFYKDWVLFGAQNGDLTALDAEKGEFAWKYEIQDQIQCSPTIVENRCFLAGCDQIFHVLDLDKKGEKIGGVKIGAPSGNTPAVLGDYVYFGTMGGVVYCVDWRKVEEKWTFSLPNNADGYNGSPAVDKWIYIIGKNKILSAIDPATGEEKWQFAGKSKSESSPVIVGDRVYAPYYDGRLYALDAATGEVRWQYETGSRLSASPAVADGKLVIANEGGAVYCFGKRS
jgi:outer membrane protein assembly factor BamB